MNKKRTPLSCTLARQRVQDFLGFLEKRFGTYDYCIRSAWVQKRNDVGAHQIEARNPTLHLPGLQQL